MILSKEGKNMSKSTGIKGFFHKKLRTFSKNKLLLVFCLPAFTIYFLLSYLPMFGALVAFKQYTISPDGGFFKSLMDSPWIGFKNFEFLFKSSNAFVIVRNTLAYNILFIILGIIIPLTVALLLHELLNKFAAKFYQTVMFLPYFLSWVIVSYCLFAFISPDKGLINNILQSLGFDKVSWYTNPKYWPQIIIFFNQWKGLGYGTVIYLAAITGIDKTYYEAAVLDGASKWRQMKEITIPMLRPVITILFILAVGGIFRADFGLFYQLPMNSGPLFGVTDVIDTYVYRALMETGDIGMSSAAGLFQSLVGAVLIITANKIVKKFDPGQELY